MMGADEISAATPVAVQALGVYGGVPMPVQIVIAVGVTLVALAIVAAWGLPRLRAVPSTAPEPASPSPGDGNEDVVALAKAITSLADEQGRHVHQMALSVDRLHETVRKLGDTIMGCQSCPHLPKYERTGT